MITAQDASVPVRLIIFDPGHFHATLLQREMLAGIDSRVNVYARLGPELLDYLNRISLFNRRAENPTRWELSIHTSEDPMRQMLLDRPGNIVVFTGRNRGKIDRIAASLEAGLNVLADKPWIISSEEMPKLEQALELAQRKGLVACDIMTERYEVTSQVQREFVNAPNVFGQLEKGSAENPAIAARSVHHVMKVVAGVPLRRPPWFFDIAEYGEGLADVGTHVVDLVQWTAFPDGGLDYRTDIRMLDARRWPLDLTLAQFEQVTGEKQFPAALAPAISGGMLHYMCNNSVNYTLRAVHVKLDISWNWEAVEGGDVYEASFQGTKARVEIRQGRAEKFVPELYIVPVDAVRASAVFDAVRKRVAALQSRWPGLAVTVNGREARVVIPERFRVGHEAHFTEVSHRFFEYLKSPQAMPASERTEMLAKYYVSTRSVELGMKK